MENKQAWETPMIESLDVSETESGTYPDLSEAGLSYPATPPP